MNWLKYLCLLSLLLGCGTASKNIVSQGHFQLKSGVQGEKRWDSSLMFNRTSWFRELSLVYDLYLASVGPESDFYAWLSEDEKELVSVCSHFYVSLGYALNSRLISHQIVERKMEELGLEKKVLMNFNLNLKMHPDFVMNSFNHYKVIGYCASEGKTRLPLALRLPGFKSVSVSL